MKKGDVIVIALVLITGLLSLFIIKNGDSFSNQKHVIIQVNNEIVNTIAIDEKTNETYRFEFNNQIGYIQVKDSKVRMLEMDKEICPKGICSDTRWIENKYETIVCLPNKISVSITQNKSISNESIDDISF